MTCLNSGRSEKFNESIFLKGERPYKAGNVIVKVVPLLIIESTSISALCDCRIALGCSKAETRSV